MSIDNEYEPYVTPQQEFLWNKLEQLTQSFGRQISKARAEALDVLLDESNSAETKVAFLENYFSYRMVPECYSTVLNDGKEYYYSDLVQTARDLLNDKNFEYSDGALVLNSLHYFFESITIDDVVLGYHYFRLAENDESLSHLAKLTAYYTQSAFEMDGLKVNYSISDGLLSRKDSIALVKSLLTFVDDFLRKYENKRICYSGAFELKEESKLDFDSRLGRNASQSMAQTSAIEICQSRLIEYLSSCNGYCPGYEVTLLFRLLPSLFDRFGINDESVASGIIMDFPTLSDLVQEAKSEYLKNKDSSRRDEYRSIYTFLHQLDISRKDDMFNNLAIIAQEDIEHANIRNEEINTDFAYDTIKRELPFLFLVIIIAKIVPECSTDKATIRWREKTCRKLCSIYTDDSAYENISESSRINIESIKDDEHEVSNKKVLLYKSFLRTLASSSVDEIMIKRLELLDQAKAIDPLDYSFLEDCSNDILNQLLNATDTPDVSSYERRIKASLESGKKKILSDQVLHTLATAEFLFSHYANNEYASQEFDFSCISALYYQAYENAYNQLIWSRYAEMLNKKVAIEGKSYYVT